MSSCFYTRGTSLPDIYQILHLYFNRYEVVVLMCILLLIIDIIWTWSANTLQVGCQHEPGGSQSPLQQHMVWPWSWGCCWGGPVWVTPGGAAGSCCSIYTTAGESDSVLVASPPKKWLVDVVVVCWINVTPPPHKRSARGAELHLLVDLLAQLQKQMKFSPKSQSCCCCCWSLSGLLAPWQQLELKYCHMSINHRHTRWAGDEMFLPHVESFKWLMEMRFWIYFRWRLTFLQSEDDNWR